MDDRTQLWNDFAAQLAVDSIRCTTAANSGHPTSSMSAAHLISVLYADHLHTNVAEPADLANDRFVLSKGHAAPVLYSALKAIGAISDDELLTLRRFGSPIQGHPAPVPELPWVDVATGSLGQGLADRGGHGVRIAARRLAGTRLGDDGRLGDGRGLGLGVHGDGVVSRAPRPDGDPRPQQARAARSHDARMERRRVPRSGRSVRVERHRDRRPRCRRDRRRLHASEGRRPADHDRRAHRERATGYRSSPTPRAGTGRRCRPSKRRRRSTSSAAFGT